MDTRQIRALADSQTLPGNQSDAVIRETHISWIILLPDHAFKIKKPVKYSFLDFTTLQKRKLFCSREVKLNRRLAPDMYLGVLPLTRGMLKEETAGDSGEIIEYAVHMRRMDGDLEMDHMLAAGRVTTDHIDSLARKLAGFHENTDIVSKKEDINVLQELFADLETVTSGVDDGGKWEKTIKECMERSHAFLKRNAPYLRDRSEKGYYRDCHGDLNTRNIFLYDEPVIFDCIEFNDEFRQIDVLSEIAFLCMDLEFFRREDLAGYFYSKYLEYSGEPDDGKSRRLFSYYKSYRANIRAKVTLLSAGKNNSTEKKAMYTDVSRYLALMEKNMPPG
jgi:uncharacterized protein